jgi:hypothetical protein
MNSSKVESSPEEMTGGCPPKTLTLTLPFPFRRHGGLLECQETVRHVQRNQPNDRPFERVAVGLRARDEFLPEFRVDVT